MEQELLKKDLKDQLAQVETPVDLDLVILEPNSRTSPPILKEIEMIDSETGKRVKRKAYIVNPARELITQDLRKGTLDKRQFGVVYGYKSLSRFLQFQTTNSRETDYNDAVNFFDDLANIRLNASVSFDPHRKTPTLLTLFKTKKMAYSGLSKTTEEDEEEEQPKKKKKWGFL